MSPGVSGFVQRRDEDGVAVLTIDSPPVNALSAAVVVQLCDALDACAQDASVQAIVVTGAGGCFIAGADITRLERIARGEQLSTASGPTLLDAIARLEGSRKPVVAAIDGFALGGGLELALACHERVGTPRARLGLPELKLGLIPGAGGTQRLPRTVGVPCALEMMLLGTELRGAAGAAAGLLAGIVEAEPLVKEACARARSLCSSSAPLQSNLRREDRIGALSAARLSADEVRARAASRYKNQIQADACIEAVLDGIEHGPEAGLERERTLFLGLLQSSQAKALIHVFFAERGVGKADLPAHRNLDHVAVLGGGTMGVGIAVALLTAGLTTTLLESSAERAKAANERVHALLDRDVTRGRASAEQALRRKQALQTTCTVSELSAAQFVIEAVTEDLAIKRALLEQVAAVVRPDVPFATNTSTLDLSTLRGGAVQSQRVIGMHFFSPAHVMKLVEVISDAQSSPAAVADARALAKRMRKSPVLVQSCPGFLLNRVFMPYGQACGFLIDRGVDPYAIDAALEAFGMPMGPCRVSDLTGIDVGLKAGAILDEAFPDRVYRSALRALLAEAGRLGEKTGAGHYAYKAGRAAPDAGLQDFVNQARALAGDPTPLKLSAEQICDHLMLPVVNEALRALNEGVVARSSDVDIAAILAYGFPAYRGGPLFWAAERGFGAVLSALSAMHAAYGIGLYRPSEALRQVAASGSQETHPAD